MRGLQRYIRQLLPLGDSKIDNGIYLWFQWVFWHWQADSFPLSHQGSPSVSFLCLWAIILYPVATELSWFWITNVNLGPKPSGVPLATILSGLLWVLWLRNQGLWSAILVGPRLRGVGVAFSVKQGKSQANQDELVTLMLGTGVAGGEWAGGRGIIVANTYFVKNLVTLRRNICIKYFITPLS